MSRHYRSLLLPLVLALSACNSTNASAPSSGFSPNAQPAGKKISWNKTTLYLNPPRGGKVAVLTYWAADGYSTDPIACQGATVQATKRKTFGNPKQYLHDRYLFVAKQHKGQCHFTAVLNNAGNPGPTATLTIDVDT